MAESLDTVIYLAGPMSGIENFNYPAFHAAAEKLRADGYRVISPAGDEQGTEPIVWGDWMRLGLRLLLLADEVRVLPGWEQSKGASLEVHVARELGMVMKSAEDDDEKEERTDSLRRAL